MISAKELHKAYEESDKVRQSSIIAKKCIGLLEKKLREIAESGFLQFHLAREDGDELSVLFFKAEPHWDLSEGESAPCTDEADVSLVQRKVVDALLDAGFAVGRDQDRIEISWAFPNEVKPAEEISMNAK